MTIPVKLSHSINNLLKTCPLYQIESNLIQILLIQMNKNVQIT